MPVDAAATHFTKGFLWFNEKLNLILKALIMKKNMHIIITALSASNAYSDTTFAAVPATLRSKNVMELPRNIFTKWFAAENTVKINPDAITAAELAPNSAKEKSCTEKHIRYVIAVTAAPLSKIEL